MTGFPRIEGLLTTFTYNTFLIPPFLDTLKLGFYHTSRATEKTYNEVLLKYPTAFRAEYKTKRMVMPIYTFL